MTNSRHVQVWRVRWKFWGDTGEAYNNYSGFISASEFYHIKGKNELICYLGCERIK